jgi:hypothetical protein
MILKGLFGTLIAITAAANASQPSASALESQAQAEFARVGTAVRERLDRAAAGDVIGARIAAQDAQAHRYRYLDIKRELGRRQSPSPPSVEAPRNPFLPDATFLAPSVSPARVAPLTLRRQDAGVRVGYPEWDMYRPHEVQDRVRTQAAEQHPESPATSAKVVVRGAGDMYSSGVAKPTDGDQAAVATDRSAIASPAEPAREPFLVYRQQLAGRDSRE